MKKNPEILVLATNKVSIPSYLIIDLRFVAKISALVNLNQSLPVHDVWITLVYKDIGFLN
jgi:hypothetical protein